MPNDRIKIGTVSTVNAAKREIRVAPQPSQEHQLNQLEWIHVAVAGAAPLRCKVAKSRLTPSGAIITLGAGVPKDAIAGMRGARVFLNRVEATPRPEGFLDLEDLVGMAVVEENGAQLGVVQAVHSAAGNDVIDVETPEGGLFSIPAVPQAIRGVDHDAMQIIVGDLTPFRVDHAD